MLSEDVKRLSKAELAKVKEEEKENARKQEEGNVKELGGKITAKGKAKSR